MGQIDVVVNTLVNGAMDDLAAAADLLDRWGLIPESYRYRNFHLVPTHGTGSRLHAHSFARSGGQQVAERPQVLPER